MDRFVICKTFGGGYYGYGVEDKAKNTLLPIRFNLIKKEAEQLIKKWNNQKTSWWDNFWYSKEIKDIKNEKEDVT